MPEPDASPYCQAVQLNLEREYDARAAFPDHVAYFEEWRRRSIVSRQTLDHALDIRYGPGRLETLDLFPASARGSPLHVFIHGGYWRALDKADFSFLADELVTRGIAAAILNYDLCPSVQLGVIIEQVQRALMWLSKHGISFGVDTSNIHLSGWSAGAHLVAMMFAKQWPGSEPVALRSGLAISGIFALRPMLQTSVNNDIRLSARSAREYSPLLLQPKVSIPFAVLVGANETSEFRRQSREFAVAWGSALPLTYYEAERAHHFSIVSQMADSATQVFATMTELMAGSGAPSRPL